jgi:hypothetical protein
VGPPSTMRGQVPVLTLQPRLLSVLVTSGVAGPIAHSLVAHHKKLNVLILSGSPIVAASASARGSTSSVSRGHKRRNGEYTSLNLDFHVRADPRAPRVHYRAHRPGSSGRISSWSTRSRSASWARCASTLALLRRQGKHAARARAPRHHGRSHVARRGVAAQARGPCAQALLRPDLGLRALAGLRPDRILPPPGRRRGQDGVHGLPAAREPIPT